MIDKGKGGKTLDRVKPVENVNNNTQGVLKILFWKRKILLHINSTHMTSRIHSIKEL